MYWPSATTSPGSIAPAPSYGFNAWLLGARLASFGGYATGFAGASAVELRCDVPLNLKNLLTMISMRYAGT